MALCDGDALSVEYNGANAIQRRYGHGPGVDEPLVWYEGAGLSDRRYLIADRQGSIIAANGASTTRYSYGPYGEPDAWTGSRFRYTGQAALPEVQLYHYKARVYDPVLGRFLQTDPIGYESDLNLYAYVFNDPLNLRDSNGERPEGLAEAQNPCMRESQRSNNPVDRGGAGPRNTTVSLLPSMSRCLAGAQQPVSRRDRRMGAPPRNAPRNREKVSSTHTSKPGSRGSALPSCCSCWCSSLAGGCELSPLRSLWRLSSVGHVARDVACRPIGQSPPTRQITSRYIVRDSRPAEPARAAVMNWTFDTHICLRKTEAGCKERTVSGA